MPQSLSMAFALAALLAALAPLDLSLRSKNWVAILTSAVLTFASVGILVIAKTSIDAIIASVLYLTNVCLAVGVFATRRICDAIEGRR